MISAKFTKTVAYSITRCVNTACSIILTGEVYTWGLCEGKYIIINYQYIHMSPFLMYYQLLVLVFATCILCCWAQSRLCLQDHLFLMQSLFRYMPQVEQELLTLPEHLSSPPVFSGFELLDLQIYVYVLQIIVCPFAFFLLAIVLYDRYTDSDYPFGIFKLFLPI